MKAGRAIERAKLIAGWLQKKVKAVRNRRIAPERRGIESTMLTTPIRIKVPVLDHTAAGAQ